jgi:hypothetical protein
MPKIIDNINIRLNQELREAIKVAFRGDFCVGYFNLRGWKEIGELIDGWPGGEGHCARLLVGMQRLPQDELRDFYRLSRDEGELDNATLLRLKKKLAEEFRTQLTIGVPTNADELALQQLAAQIKAKKVTVKLYLSHPLHAKLYLLHRADYANPIIGFVGSSNLTLAGLAVLVAVPFLPASYTARMSTIENHESDQSASTRVEVWKWTLDYVKEHPFGGGFDAYRGNSIRVETRKAVQHGSTVTVEVGHTYDKARAYHSSYFEMLGEQGFPGLFIWLLIHVGGVWRMEMVARMYKRRNRPDESWVAPLATALQNAQIIYLVGSLFVGIAFQPFVYMLVAMQLGLDTYLARRRNEAAWTPIRKQRMRAREA